MLKKHSLKTLDAMQLSVVKSVNQPELKGAVSGFGPIQMYQVQGIRT